MIKVFTTNKNGKIELTKDELKALLDEAYWDGYRAHNGSYIYTSPTVAPYRWTGTSTCGPLPTNVTSTNVTLTNTVCDHTVGTADIGIGASVDKEGNPC